MKKLSLKEIERLMKLTEREILELESFLIELRKMALNKGKKKSKNTK